MECLVLLTALIGVDLAITDTAAPQLAITETAKPCPCGIAGCSCPAGECDCGGKATSTIGNDSGRDPHIIATVASRGCPPCERWKSETLPKLIEAGWRVEIREVPLNSQSVPSFEFQGRKLDGYGGRDEFYAWLRSPVSPAGVAAPAPVAASVGFQPAPQVVTRPSIPPARRTWTYRGSDLAAHVRNTHGVNVPPGLSHQELVRLHSHAHENTLHLVGNSGFSSASPARKTYYMASPRMVLRSGCPGGRCP